MENVKQFRGISEKKKKNQGTPKYLLPANCLQIRTKIIEPGRINDKFGTGEIRNQKKKFARNDTGHFAQHLNDSARTPPNYCHI